jgi:hypothetical protein
LSCGSQHLYEPDLKTVTAQNTIKTPATLDFPETPFSIAPFLKYSYIYPFAADRHLTWVKACTEGNKAVAADIYDWQLDNIATTLKNRKLEPVS